MPSATCTVGMNISSVATGRICGSVTSQPRARGDEDDQQRDGKAPVFVGKQQKHILRLQRRQPLAFGGENVTGGQMRALRVAQAGTEDELAKDAQKQRQRPEARPGGFLDRQHEPALRPGTRRGEGDEDQQAVEQLAESAMRDSQRV